jgi:hypothetical protein
MSIKTDFAAVVKAVQDLITREKGLFILDVGERAIAHRLACHLEFGKGYEKWDIDCEYNKDGLQSSKYVQALEGPIRERALKRAAQRGEAEYQRALLETEYLIYPDIIVHHRGEEGHWNNRLVIEIKKTTNSDDREIDEHKLKLLTADREGYDLNFHYQGGLFIEFTAWKEIPDRGIIEAVATLYKDGKAVAGPETLATHSFVLREGEAQ